MKTYTFIKHLKGVSNKTNPPKPYNFVELSDGRNSFTINVSKDADIPQFNEGDEVEPIVEIYGGKDGFARSVLVDLK